MARDLFHDRQARGRTRTGWLQAFHTFSFGSFNDPTRMGYRALRVINEDVIAGGSGFAEHGHEHFEILTFVLSGTLEHQDSAGNTGRLKAGDVQLISAGTGIRHSERNPSPESSTHLFQIWLHGNADALPPRYQLAPGALSAETGDVVQLLAAPDPAAVAVQLRANVRIWSGVAPAGASAEHHLKAGRYGWLQCLEGALHIGTDDEAQDLELRGGDALQLASVRSVRIVTDTPARWLWFDLD